MAWMMDTYSMQVGYAVPEVVTGKPISIGGSVFRSEATGAGVVMVIERACQQHGWNLAEQGCVVQGFGNVGGIAVRDLESARREGARGLGHLRRRLSPAGLDLDAVRAWVDEHGTLRATRTPSTSRTPSCSSCRATSSSSPPSRSS